MTTTASLDIKPQPFRRCRALPMQRGEAPAEIHLKLKAVVVGMRRDDKDIEDKLADYSEAHRKRITDAYAKVLAEIRVHYPHLANVTSD